jgi:CHAT domain-containing protein/predicted negative regulator of RcsB-dependent stress response
VTTTSNLQSHLIRLALACIAVCLLPAMLSTHAPPVFAQQNSKPQAELLSLNQRVDGVISADDSRSYDLTLDAGQYLRIEVVAKRIDLTIFDSKDQLVADRACDNRYLTPVSVVAKTAGRYRVALRSLETGRSVQHFSFIVAELRQTAPTDLVRIEAEESFTKATRLRRKGETRSSEEALKSFQSAQRSWMTVRDLQDESLALLSLGRTYEALNQNPLKFYQQALEIGRILKDHRRQTEALAQLVGYYTNGVESDTAIKYGNQTLVLARQLNDKHIEAETLNNIGDAQYQLGDLLSAVEQYNKAFALSDALGDLTGKAAADIHLGYTFLNLSETEKARNSYRDALLFSNQGGDRQMQAISHRALGNFYTKVGQPQHALNAFRQALELIDKDEGLFLKAQVLAGMGHAYERLGDAENALDYDNQAVKIFKQLGNKWGVGELLMDLGRVYYLNNDSKQALESYKEALPLVREQHMTRHEAQILSGMGLIYASSGDYTRALESYQTSLQTKRSPQDQPYDAYTYNYLGDLYLATGKRAEALESFRQALSINQTALDRVGEAMTLYNLARANRDMGALSEAATYSEQALTIIESVRAEVASEKLRASFAASVHQQYELRIDILMREHLQNPSGNFNVAALEVSERGRARSWLESLAGATTQISEGVDQILLDRAAALQKKLDAKGQEQVRPHTKEEEQALAAELSKLTRDYEEIQDQIRARRGVAEISGPKPLSGRQLQEQIDSDSLLLEFSLGEDRSYIWLVSANSIESKEIPGRKIIEPMCRSLYDALVARSREARSTSLSEEDARVERLSAEVAQMLLQPVRDSLRQKRLLIVADGALQYLPFEVLRDPNQTPAQPLVADHEIIYLPSASVIAEQRTKFSNRPLAPRLLAIFADPVFDRTDDRVTENRSSRNNLHARREVKGSTRSIEDDSDLKGALRAAGFEQKIPRLFYSNQEARRVSALLPKDQGVMELGFDANRDNATSSELHQYRFLHFATHGLLNSDHPELSGIVLSMVDKNGNSQNGLLQLHEIYNMNLPVELVVLSACQTALGKEVRGEGLFGLTRGFMYAGARRTISSLWKVDDSATAELMELFYQEMLVNGRTPAAALQRAKNTLRKQKAWEHPFNWAGFIIQGDWR